MPEEEEKEHCPEKFMSRLQIHSVPWNQTSTKSKICPAQPFQKITRQIATTQEGGRGPNLTWPPLGGGAFVAVAGGMCLGKAWVWLNALALLLLLNSSVQVWASESPDRECCEPLYPFIPPPPPALTTPKPPTPRTTPRSLPQPITQPPRRATTNRPYVDVTIEQQEIATRPRRPGKA